MFRRICTIGDVHVLDDDNARIVNDKTYDNNSQSASSTTQSPGKTNHFSLIPQEPDPCQALGWSDSCWSHPAGAEFLPVLRGGDLGRAESVNSTNHKGYS